MTRQLVCGSAACRKAGHPAIQKMKTGAVFLARLNGETAPRTFMKAAGNRIFAVSSAKDARTGRKFAQTQGSAISICGIAEFFPAG